MAETLLNQQEPVKVDSSSDGHQQNMRLKRIIGIILSIVMIALTAYVLRLQYQNSNILAQSSDLALTANVHQASNYRSYVQQYKETKAELEATTRKLEQVNHQLDQVTAELTATKASLSQTQEMLAQAQGENIKLKQDLKGLDSLRNAENVQTVSQLQAKIKGLKQKDSQVTSELTRLKVELRAFQADFSTLDEGKSLITLFQSKIKLVKSRMHYLREQVYYAKVEAQKQKDRLATLNGNNGFLVRDGKVQKPEGANKSFSINVKILQ